MAVAAAAHRSSEGVVLYIVPTDADIDAAVSDIRFFLSALEGLADAAAEQQVLPFPHTQVDPYRGFVPHLKVASARAAALHALAAGDARVVVASATALLPRVPDPAALLLASFELKPGIEVDPVQLANTLVTGGYEPADPVDSHGEFCRRGGILDVFPAGDELPVRIEFIGDTVESIRRFDPGTQRSVETLDRFGLVPVRESLVEPKGSTPQTGGGDSGGGEPLGSPESSLFDYIALKRSQDIIIAEPEELKKNIEAMWEQVSSAYAERQAKPDGRKLRMPGELLIAPADIQQAMAGGTTIEELGIGEPGAGTQETALHHVSCQPVAPFHGRIPDWLKDVRQAQERGDLVVFVAGSHGRAERTVEMLHDYELRAVMAADAGDVVAGAVLVAEGWLSKGFRLSLEGEGFSPRQAGAEAPALQIYAEADVFEDERRPTSGKRKKSHTATFLSDLRDLKVGDLIVHVDHGIGQFVGLKQISVANGDVVQEFLELVYHGDAKLFVPVERLDLIQKFTAGSKPPLDRLGGTTWEKAKNRVKKAMRDMAEELLKLYAARKAVPGHAFGPDTHWQEEFEDAFEFDLTPDQASAIADIKRDMESSTPMDRLLCGDVGYGKT